MDTSTVLPPNAQRRLRTAYFTRNVTRHWLLIFLVVYGLFNLLPFLAPVFMQAGWTWAGNAIYGVYSPLCHQMAQRSFFLFGSKLMYSPEQLPLQLTGDSGTDMLLLRQFRGDAIIGWKVAWSDRMVAMYGGVWLAGAAYLLLSRLRSMKPMSLWTLGLLLLPMVLDGGTHMISDTGDGLFGGFRYHNKWLATMTGHALPASFYVGDALGSFNSWMRLISGLLFGIGIVGFAFPYIDRFNQESAQTLTDKLDRLAETQRRLQAELKRPSDR